VLPESIRAGIKAMIQAVADKTHGFFHSR